MHITHVDLGSASFLLKMDKTFFMTYLGIEATIVKKITTALLFILHI